MKNHGNYKSLPYVVCITIYIYSAYIFSRYRMAGKFGRENVWRGEFALFKRLVEKSLANDRSAKRLLIVTTTLDGFSLANCRRFAKFAKFSTHQTFPLYSMKISEMSQIH